MAALGGEKDGFYEMGVEAHEGHLVEEHISADKVCFKLLFTPEHTAIIFMHTILISFAPCSGINANQAEGRKICLCMHLPAVCRSCFNRYFKLALKMNTQMAVVYHQSSSQPPGMCGW